MALMLHIGLQIGGVAALTAESFDLKAGELRLPHDQ